MAASGFRCDSLSAVWRVRTGVGADGSLSEANGASSERASEGEAAGAARSKRRRRARWARARGESAGDEVKG